MGPEDKCILDKPNTYSGHGYEEQSNIPNIYNHHHSGTYPGVSPVNHPNIKIVEHDHNDNHNIYILPDQYRARTYSHGSGGSRGHYPDTERTYRPYVPNTYTEDERQMRYRQFQHLQQKQQQLQESHRPQYTGSIEYKHLDNADIVRRTSQGTYERDFRASHYTPITDYQIYYKNSSQSQQSLLRRDRDSSSSGGKNVPRHNAISSASIETQLLSGYWVRHNDDIHWVSIDEPDRFGSLDRRRRNAHHNSVGANSDVQSRYRTVAVTGVKGSPVSSNIVASSNQHHSVHLLPLAEQMPLANNNHNKMLLRTQSLGSVETWQSSYSHDSHDGKDASAAEYANNNNNNNNNRKSRQKEWYETSVDSGASASLDRNLIAAHKNTLAYQSSPPPIRIKTVNNENGRNQTSGGPLPNMSLVNRHKRDKPEECRQHAIQQPHAHYDQSATRPKVLEIPAESKPSLDVCDDAIRPSLGSPQNCTVVQPGKYQPYREVTKPFEMSDFYKYSTKFRKRNEVAAQSETGNDSPLQENRPTEIGSSDLSRNPNTYNFAQNIDNVTASPVQRRLYQPVQRMTCQPYLSSLR